MKLCNQFTGFLLIHLSPVFLENAFGPSPDVFTCSQAQCSSNQLIVNIPAKPSVYEETPFRRSGAAKGHQMENQKIFLSGSHKLSGWVVFF